MCKAADGCILENTEVNVEEACAEETSVESTVNVATSSSSNIYQIVTNPDGSVSLVGLDPTQLDQLLSIQGNIDILCAYL